MTKLERRKKRLKNLDRAGIQNAAERSILSVMIIHNVPMSADVADFMETWLRDEGEYLFSDLVDDAMYTNLVSYASRMIAEHNNKTRIAQIESKQ